MKLAPYLYTPLKQQYISKTIFKNMYRFKMAANVVMSISQKWSRDQNLKNHFPKRIFQ